MIRCCVQTGPDSLCFEVALIAVMINQCICLSAAGGNCAGCLAFGGVLAIAQKWNVEIGGVEPETWLKYGSHRYALLCKTSFDWERSEIIAFIYTVYLSSTPILHCVQQTVHKQINLIWVVLWQLQIVLSYSTKLMPIF